MPRSGYLLLCVVVMLLIYPWTIGRMVPQVLFEVASTLVAVASVTSITTNVRLRQLGTVLGSLFVVVNLSAAAINSAYLIVFALLLALVFYLVVILGLLDAFMHHRRVTVDTLCSALCVYLLIGIWFGSVYTLLALITPNSFDGRLTTGRYGNIEVADLMYFSYSTLTTAGYGDIFPLSPQARFLAVFEQIIGVVYTTVIMARLVALYTNHESRSQT